MAENYNILKENNLRQMVSEYEKEQHEKKQRHLEYVKDTAELENARMSAFYSKSVISRYNHNGFMLLYAIHYYQNALADLIRNYATVHDANNLDTYPVSTPLPKMEDVWDSSFPFNYSKLQELAAYCSKWRQK